MGDKPGSPLLRNKESNPQQSTAKPNLAPYKRNYIVFPNEFIPGRQVSLISQYQLNVICRITKIQQIKSKIYTNILIEKERVVDKTQHFYDEHTQTLMN